MKKRKNKFLKKISDSPINYFSDLFIVVMIAGWAIAIPIVCIAAIYAMIKISDTSVWTYFVELITVPLTAGGAIWMIKNSVQHAIMNKQGKKCEPDFPAVNADGENDGKEVLIQPEETGESED